MKLPKLKLNERVEILWHDAHDCADDDKTWQDRDSIVQKPVYYEVLSIGYFVKRENGFIYIVADLVGPLVSRSFAIPEGCVKAIKRL